MGLGHPDYARFVNAYSEAAWLCSLAHYRRDEVGEMRIRRSKGQSNAVTVLCMFGAAVLGACYGSSFLEPQSAGGSTSAASGATPEIQQIELHQGFQLSADGGQATVTLSADELEPLYQLLSTVHFTLPVSGTLANGGTAQPVLTVDSTPPTTAGEREQRRVVHTE